METILVTERWSYLEPLRRLKPIYWDLRKPEKRLRKPGAELLKSGATANNPQRMGLITFEARLRGSDQVPAVLSEMNAAAASRRCRRSTY